jgi:3-oxoadipate CoA-transferase beta subunit
VAENGDIANWARSADEPVKQVGGAMDPLTAKGVVTRVYTNLAVLDVTPRGFVVRDMIPGMTLEKLQARTEAKLHSR